MLIINFTPPLLGRMLKLLHLKIFMYYDMRTGNYIDYPSEITRR